ncbi:hypothetical protein [Azohydromonas aeria]|uniref:hypothetical protein n=1 Tax=Azohydromonas aeria TaxID=2590212 RepID=UPI0012F96974|nr:hypothetical protein [Azohydromonas aeria]
MPATVRIIQKTGAGGTATDASGGIRFKNADNATVDLVNPMVKPASGSDFSFEKWLRLEVTGGTYTQITNIRAYSDGANGMGTGINLWAKAVTNYAQPAEPTSTSGFTNFFSYTSASPLSLGAGPYTGNGEKGDHVVLMMEVQSTASGGLTATETASFSWDEI